MAAAGLSLDGAFLAVQRSPSHMQVVHRHEPGLFVQVCSLYCGSLPCDVICRGDMHSRVIRTQILAKTGSNQATFLPRTSHIQVAQARARPVCAGLFLVLRHVLSGEGTEQGV